MELCTMFQAFFMKAWPILFRTNRMLNREFLEHTSLSEELASESKLPTESLQPQV